ncbi:MAG: hypothetical protein ACE5NG_18055 [bacterium]
MIKKHLPVREDVSIYRGFDRTVRKAVILVPLCLAFLVTNPVADVFLMTCHPPWRER